MNEDEQKMSEEFLGKVHELEQEFYKKYNIKQKTPSCQSFNIALTAVYMQLLIIQFTENTKPEYLMETYKDFHKLFMFHIKQKLKKAGYVPELEES